jgi:hypothetical protein
MNVPEFNSFISIQELTEYVVQIKWLSHTKARNIPVSTPAISRRTSDPKEISNTTKRPQYTDLKIGRKLRGPAMPICFKPSSWRCCSHFHVGSFSSYTTSNTKEFITLPIQ